VCECFRAKVNSLNDVLTVGNVIWFRLSRVRCIFFFHAKRKIIYIYKIRSANKNYISDVVYVFSTIYFFFYDMCVCNNITAFYRTNSITRSFKIRFYIIRRGILSLYGHSIVLRQREIVNNRKRFVRNARVSRINICACVRVCV